MSNTHAPSLGLWGGRRLPLILQTEAAECGLACIAMVAGYWGHQIDMPSMRRRFSVSLKGATLSGLIGIGRALSLNSRALKLDLEFLVDLKLPCVLHWDMNHFVVLKEVSSSGAVIHDPAAGERRFTTAQLSKHFTGVALELSPAESFKPIEETHRFTLMSLMGRVTGLKRSLVQVLTLALALQVCALVLPFYLQWVVDEAIVAADRELLTTLGIGFLLLVLMQTLMSTARSWVTTVLSTDLNFQWLGNAFAHMMKLPVPFFEKRHLGDVVSRFGSIQAIQHSLTTQFVEGVIDGLLVVCTLAVMLFYSVQLTLVACAAMALYGLIRWSIFRSLRAATSEQIIHAAKQQTHFLESVRGIQSVRLFGRSEERRSGWMNLLADQFNADLRIARLSMSYQAANTLLSNGERIVVIWLAALAVLDTRLSVGMMFAFIAYKDQFSQRVAALIDKLFEWRMLRLHGERVADVVLTPAEEEFAQIEIVPPAVMPDISVRQMSFRYADGEPPVLSDIDLTIPSGECIAITGPSGCGKTTLVKLILGLAEPSTGELRVGEVTLRQMGLTHYRRLVGTVMQDDQLFSGSIADNICFFDPAPDQAKIEAVAQSAAVEADILDMPMGYNTLVGDIGTGLSGGQKQRILLARALYKNPKLLVLDEATSHLDIDNEQLVNAAIQQLSLTRIIVAHRPDTIAMASRVIVMDKGRIVRDYRQQPLHAVPALTANFPASR